MSDTIRVAPVEGRTMVRESNPRLRITDECTVPNTSYYRRAIARGDLEEVKPGSKRKPAAPAAEKG